jgi:hypothetical protein
MGHDEKLVDEELLDTNEEDLETQEDEEEETDTDEAEQEDSEESEDQPEKHYSAEEVSAIVKTRVGSMNKKVEKLKSYRDTVERLAELSGMTTDALMIKLSTMSDAEQAKILGLTPEQYAQKKLSTAKIKHESAETVALRRELEENKLAADPKFKDFEIYKEQVYDLLDDNPN